MEHFSVMLQETIDGLQIKEDGIYVDGTLGRAGHSKAIAKCLTTGHLFAFDKDQTAIERSKEVLGDQLPKVTLIHQDFSTLKETLNSLGIEKIDGFVLDLGVSSPQFDDATRGFSYRFDARLDMRMDQSQTLDAYKIVNTYSYQELVRILFQYGEEKYAKQIARKIEAMRQIKPIETTFELVDVIKMALPAKVLSKKGHPAKQTFQALRIEVNQELASLQAGLNQALDMLASEGIGCVITFHSLEDRIVKEEFKKRSSVAHVDKRIPLTQEQMAKPAYELVNRKPILASSNELEVNNRSHSAKLRIIKRV
ncbi:MAG: 16S rRNA (cytosine(1402)-N(4))-methyltransferase RsmH [Erysipelotrichaceae bacterium]|nr:16S rRNA (cytosine(1402)-N(4))-methyltransferase RsmH [Erysipelotrichaceae bacterium]MDY5252473.1 16S rRNA (cytosine(1402)-N(4))-methyltransferase RsmH [Erysipelotrichaceae bacterium]